MRFWDTSALVALLRQEPASETCRALLRTDTEIVVWWGTLIECTAALSRVERMETTTGLLRSGHERLQRAAAGWLEIPPSEAIRNDARRLVRVHPLSAADGLQLAAARAVCRGDTQGFPFVCIDRQLRMAAEREGFDVVRPVAAE